MHNPRSGIVLVNGCGDRAGAISPVSCVVVNLAHGLRRQGTPVLVFFCGLHTGDELRSPGGLLRCLVAQLVVVLLDKGWMEEGECVGGRMEDLGGLFGRLMELVPEGCVVFGGRGWVRGGRGVAARLGEGCGGAWEGCEGGRTELVQVADHECGVESGAGEY